MKNMSDFNFSAFGGFFAFSNEQLEEGLRISNCSKEDLTSCGNGLFAPKEKAKEMMKALSEFSDNKKAERIEKEGLENIILYELRNYECFYNYDITDAVPILKEYGATEEQIWKVFKKNKHRFED